MFIKFKWLNKVKKIFVSFGLHQLHIFACIYSETTQILYILCVLKYCKMDMSS